MFADYICEYSGVLVKNNNYCYYNFLLLYFMSTYCRLKVAKYLSNHKVAEPRLFKNTIKRYWLCWRATQGKKSNELGHDRKTRQ